MSCCDSEYHGRKILHILLYHTSLPDQRAWIHHERIKIKIQSPRPKLWPRLFCQPCPPLMAHVVVGPFFGKHGEQLEIKIARCHTTISKLLSHHSWRRWVALLDDDHLVPLHWLLQHCRDNDQSTRKYFDYIWSGSSRSWRNKFITFIVVSTRYF